MEIAGAKGHAHLGAISERTRLAVAVTDILIQRGDTGMVRKLSQNQGAIFRSRLCDIGQAQRRTSGWRKISACVWICRPSSYRI
jgi:hypothetical protein